MLWNRFPCVHNLRWLHNALHTQGFWVVDEWNNILALRYENYVASGIKLWVEFNLCSNSMVKYCVGAFNNRTPFYVLQLYCYSASHSLLSYTPGNYFHKLTSSSWMEEAYSITILGMNDAHSYGTHKSFMGRTEYLSLRFGIYYTLQISKVVC